MPLRESAARIDDRQRQHAVAVRQIQRGGRHPGMAGDVGQCLLRDAVHDELGLGCEDREAWSDPLSHLETRPLRKALTEHGQRAFEPEVVQGAGRSSMAMRRSSSILPRTASWTRAGSCVGQGDRRSRAQREQHSGRLPRPIWSCISCAIRNVLPLARRARVRCRPPRRSASSRAALRFNGVRSRSSSAPRRWQGRGRPLARGGEVTPAGERRPARQADGQRGARGTVQRHDSRSATPSTPDRFLIGVQRRDALGRQHRDRDHDGDEQQQRVDAGYAVEQRHISAPFLSL